MDDIISCPKEINLDLFRIFRIIEPSDILLHGGGISSISIITASPRLIWSSLYLSLTWNRAKGKQSLVLHCGRAIVVTSCSSSFPISQTCIALFLVYFGKPRFQFSSRRPQPQKRSRHFRSMRYHPEGVSEKKHNLAGKGPDCKGPGWHLSMLSCRIDLQRREIPAQK